MKKIEEITQDELDSLTELFLDTDDQYSDFRTFLSVYLSDADPDIHDLRNLITVLEEHGFDIRTVPAQTGVDQISEERMLGKFLYESDLLTKEGADKGQLIAATIANLVALKPDWLMCLATGQPWPWNNDTYPYNPHEAQNLIKQLRISGAMIAAQIDLLIARPWDAKGADV